MSDRDIGQQETVLERAIERLEQIKQKTVQKHEALREFSEKVEGLSTAPVQERSTVINVLNTVSGGSKNESNEVKRAFEEAFSRRGLLEEYDSSVLDIISEELSREVATSLAQTGSSSFTPETKKSVLTEAKKRTKELDLFLSVLEKEREMLDEAVEKTERIDYSLDEMELASMGFDELSEVHDRLDSRQERCDKLVQRRQEFLNSTSARGAQVGLEHRVFVESLYREESFDYPIIRASTRELRKCELLREKVRKHLSGCI